MYSCELKKKILKLTDNETLDFWGDENTAILEKNV